MATCKGLMPQNLERIFPVKLRRSTSGEEGSARTMRRSARRGARNMRGTRNVMRGTRNVRSEEHEEECYRAMEHEEQRVAGSPQYNHRENQVGSQWKWTLIPPSISQLSCCSSSLKKFLWRGSGKDINGKMMQGSAPFFAPH